MTTTSSRPNRSCACRTAAKSASRSVTSSCRGRNRSPWAAARSSNVERSRAVAATESPRSSAAIVHSRPKPREAPVMNQIFCVMPPTLRLRLQVPAPGRLDLLLGRDPPGPAATLHPLARLDLLVDGEEVPDLLPLELGEVDEVAQVLLPRIVRGHAQHLVGRTLLVQHPV